MKPDPLREAKAFIYAMKEYDDLERHGKARELEEMALSLYVENGLDPQWTDEEALREHQHYQPAPSVVERSDDHVVLHDDRAAEVPSAGITATRDSFVDTTDWA